MKKIKFLTIIAIAFIVLFNGCEEDDYEATEFLCPVVVSTIPVDEAIDVPLNQIISATFNDKMEPATINQQSFIIQQDGTSIAGTVTYSGLTATFTPSGPLLPDVLYSGTIKTLAKDLIGQSLMEDYHWSFTTIAEVTLSSNPAAGGTVSGEGTFDKGSSVIVTATPNEGYSFVNWTLNDTPVSTSPDYQFTMDGNKALVANFTVQLVVGLSSNPAEGGTTTGGGTYDSGTSVTVTAEANEGYSFSNWTEGTNMVSEDANYTFTITGNRELVANFTENPPEQFIVELSSNPAEGGTTTGGGTFDLDASVTVTAEASEGYSFTNWTEGTDVVSEDANYTFTITGNRELVANFTENPPVGPAAVNLGTAGNFSILTKSGISTTGITSVQGDIGVSPAAATAITGFALIMDTNGQSSHTTVPTLVTGKVYASDYAPPTPAMLTTAVSDMETAYTTANNLVTPAPVLEEGAGNISGLTLAPGLYKWSTGVLIDPDASVTLSGGENDTWVFQIAQDLTLMSKAQVKLLGGAQAKNITWVVAGQAVLGTESVLFGTILSKTLISLNTGSTVTGRLLAQTAVTLNASTVVSP
jgi:hypothetical protein